MIPLYARPDHKHCHPTHKYFPGFPPTKLNGLYCLKHNDLGFYFGLDPGTFNCYFKERTNEEYYYFPMILSLSHAEEICSDIELEEHVIADVKAKKCKFLVLSTMEGWDWPFFEKIPNALHEKYGFDHNEDFVFATGNAKDYWRLTKVYHNWWELNLSIQNFLHFKNMMLPVINGTTLRPKKFIFLNRRPSIERVAAVTYMYECRKDGIKTLAKGDKMWGASYIESSWREAPINYPSIFEEFSDVNLQERVPLKVNDGVDAEIENPVDDTSHEKFQDSYIHIVAETFQASHPNRLFFSEKIFKPMKYMQPFILLGEPGALAKLHELGYQTFGDYWDESYDDIEDDEERLKQALQTAKTLIQLTHAQLHQLTKDLLPILHHNLAHAAKRSFTMDYEYVQKLRYHLNPEADNE